MLSLPSPVLTLITAHIAQQEERLSKLELERFNVIFFNKEYWEFFSALQKVSDEWSCRWLTLDALDAEDDDEIDTELQRLAESSANGSIGTFCLDLRNRLHHHGSRIDDLKVVWKMSEKFLLSILNRMDDEINIGGGRGADDEAEWQRLVELVFV